MITSVRYAFLAIVVFAFLAVAPAYEWRVSNGAAGVPAIELRADPPQAEPVQRPRARKKQRKAARPRIRRAKPHRAQAVRPRTRPPVARSMTRGARPAPAPAPVRAGSTGDDDDDGGGDDDDG
jgi:hypothetical protein